jgi:hypothetical protein
VSEGICSSYRRPALAQIRHQLVYYNFTSLPSIELYNRKSKSAFKIRRSWVSQIGTGNQTPSLTARKSPSLLSNEPTCPEQTSEREPTITEDNRETIVVGLRDTA